MFQLRLVRIPPPFCNHLPMPQQHKAVKFIAAISCCFQKAENAFGANAFRSTKEGALSYFIGGNPDFPEDTGFALKRWVNVRYDNNAAENGIQIHGEIAITMGNFYLTNSEGKEIVVEKTLVFRRCSDGKLRLCAHKSALPFDPAK